MFDTLSFPIIAIWIARLGLSRIFSQVSLSALSTHPGVPTAPSVTLLTPGVRSSVQIPAFAMSNWYTALIDSASAGSFAMRAGRDSVKNCFVSAIEDPLLQGAVSRGRRRAIRERREERPRLATRKAEHAEVAAPRVPIAPASDAEAGFVRDPVEPVADRLAETGTGRLEA